MSRGTLTGTSRWPIPGENGLDFGVHLTPTSLSFGNVTFAVVQFSKRIAAPQLSDQRMFLS